MKTSTVPNILSLSAYTLVMTSTLHAESLIDSWYTSNSTKYARVYETETDRNNATTVTSWTDQTNPVYADIQAIYSSSSWVYVRYSGLSSHTMGPWLKPDGSQFLFWPVNQAGIHRFPRTAQVQAGTKDATGGGYSGLFVNGVAVFNSLDGQAWDGSQIQSQGSHTQNSYYWHRNAPVAEAFNFDTGNSHQPPTGIYHSHQNPIALRYQLGDHVEENPSFTNDSDSWDFYQEKTTTPSAHSPIIGWAHDGYPIYGPYGYDNPDTESTDSTIRRMVSGFVERNGSNGTDRLNANLNVIPIWYAKYREDHFGENYGSYSTAERTIADSRPSLGQTYPRGTFAQDHEYLGELSGWSQYDGTGSFNSTSHFDLDRYNGRFCRTPEFPEGTYAYFCAIDDTGESTYPYVLGFEFYGDATGGSVTNITESVTDEYIGGPHTNLEIGENGINEGTVHLTWNSVEGGTYQVESSNTEASGYSVEASNLSGTGDTMETSYEDADGYGFMKVTRTALATYDDVFTSAPSSTQEDTMEYSTPGPTVPVIYVNASRTGQGNQDGLSWATAFADLQDALASAESGDEIWVAAGIYYPDEAEAGVATVTNDDNYAQFNLIAGVTIYGGFNGTETIRAQRDVQNNLTILSGDIDQNDTNTAGVILDSPSSNIQGTNSRIIVASPSGTNYGIDGFTITASSGGDAPTAGGGSYRNCTIRGNIGRYAGAHYGEGELFQMVYCDLINNEGGNYGALNSCSQYGAYITSCRIIGNKATSTTYPSVGGIEVASATYYITNCLIAGNSGYHCGGIMNRNGGVLDLANCTIANNLARSSENTGVEAGGISDEDICLNTFNNTIVWGNEKNGSSSNVSLSTPSNYYTSLIEGLNPGGDNLDGTKADNDPLFLTTVAASSAPNSSGDYRLPGYSPAVDSGSDVGNPDDITDLDDDGNTSELIPLDLQGNNRVINTNDIGAYEYNGPSPVSTESVTLSVQEGDGEFNYSLNFNTIFGRTDLTYSLVSVTPSNVIYHEYSGGSEFSAYANEGAEAGDSATVTIQVTDEDGNTTQFTFTVTVIPAPVAPSDALAQSMSSWYTDRSSRFARIFETYTDESNGTSVTTWDNGTYSQNTPVFAGPQEISYTDNYVYVKTPNLTTHIMGPWYNDNGPGGSEVVFNNWPSNQAMIYKIPRLATIPASKTAFAANSIGIMVDGTVLFSTSDTFSWDNDENGSGSGSDTGPGVQGGGQGDGIWTHEAAVTEGNTFDKSNSHGAGDVLHYHASPTGLRYLLGDNMDYDESTNTYTPVTEEDLEFNNTHSPIIGWMNDGLPIYGPYGYSDPYDSTSSVRRMIRGFIKRDGSNGTYNLTSNGRTALAAWNARILGIGTEAGVDQFNLTVNQQGPNVSSDYPIGYFMEDYAYKGDLAGFSIYDGSVTFDESIHYDLNEQNVRYCVTPEFPDGTWAYFTNVDSDGVPQFPYNVAQQYYGNPDNGGSINSIPTNDGDNVVTFQGGINKQETISEMEISDGTVLVWSGVEGGTYLAEVSTDMSNWTPHDSDPSVSKDKVTLVDSPAVMEDQKFFRITRLTDPTYDDTPFGDGSGGGGGGSGSTVDFAFTFGTTPPLPQEQEINSATVGGVTATIVSYDSGTGNVTLSFDPSSLSGPSSAQLQFVASGGPQAGNTVTLTSTNTYSP
ncbi:YHYH protein [Rubritalea squalenifaciens DSM 18772]|uniref:YHYH protein n=1 Tax=Rubritalea squalenifaciens DSM 18772 TaxID=1123071 RepID=A0A1M6R8V1_9BACT|nr:YHYH protein [Rubritalea squalenifaciens]SHK28882.1 YHYH protein [Rubritalea squalenifaciens DSM 18772]